MQGTGMKCVDGKFREHLFGVLIIWAIVYVSFIECNIIKGRLPETSLITNFVQRFIQPYIQSLQSSDDKPMQRSFEETPVQKAIQEVVVHLRPYLQDDDNDKDDKAPLVGSSETTIIEFIPKPRIMLRAGKETEKEPEKKLQTTIDKYEKIKSKIKEALERDSVGENTKKIVTRTLDELIAQVIGNQCTWKSVDHSMAVFRNNKGAIHNITLEEWEDLNKEYLKFFQSKQLKESLYNDFRQFVSKVINDTQQLSKKYKIKCQLIKVGADDKTSTVKDTERAQNNCEDFKVCSDEFKEFLLDFYKSLDDTTVSVFKNFAAMYTRDVITDSDDSKDIDSVPNVINKMDKVVDRRVSNVFIQELNKLKLDEQKDNEANSKILREFVRVTCKRVLKHVKKHLASDLSPLSAKLLLSVKQDINMNLGLDLGNLEADIKGRICTVFVTCNGRVSENRRSLANPGKPPLDRNSVYVKVQLTLNDRLKGVIVDTKRELLGSLKKELFNTNHNKIGYRRNDNVTRTTTAGTTNINFNHSDTNDILRNSVYEKF